MAEFSAKCPHCGQAITAEDDWKGLEAECPTCQKTLILEPIREEENVATVMPPDEKACPHCGQRIKKEAIFCKHCKTKLIDQKMQKITCQYCAETVEIPENSHRGTLCPICGQELPLPQVVQTPQVAIAVQPQPPPANRKPCPLCGEMIKADVDFCLFCKRDISKTGTFAVECKRCASMFEIDYSMDKKKISCPTCGFVFPAISQRSKDEGLAKSGLFFSVASFILIFLAGWIGLIFFAIYLGISIYAMIELKKKSERLMKLASFGIIANLVAAGLAIIIKLIIFF